MRERFYGDITCLVAVDMAMEEAAGKAQRRAGGGGEGNTRVFSIPIGKGYPK